MSTNNDEPDIVRCKFYKHMSASTVQKVLDKSSFRWALPKTFNAPHAACESA